ncbi:MULTISPECIES: M48 family metallopeptidase [unclassified Sphingomonas]|uniref:M48 family metallopeptidase n=1 Tax=unclassified Sphingomonas TaxID=196159 RepID=UPI0035A8D481
MSDTVRVGHYDGQIARRRDVALVADGNQFVLTEGDATTGPFAFADLVAREPVDGQRVFGLKRAPGWSITLSDEPPTAITYQLPPLQRYGGLIDRLGLWPMVVLFAVIAGVALYILAQTPSVVAKLVPPALERQLGNAMIGDFGGRLCSDPAGEAAIATLKARLGPAYADSEIGVANIQANNAITLPGGRIIIFNGLLRDATSPDEVAGVLGHELGHVANRDVLESLLRQLGLSVLLGGLDGNIGGYTNMLLSTAYSRSAETRADDFAIAALKESGISTKPTGAFFRRLSDKDPLDKSAAGSVLAYVSSHPVSALRADRFERAAAGSSGTRPALDAEQWAALKSICKGAKPASKTIIGF